MKEKKQFRCLKKHVFNTVLLKLNRYDFRRTENIKKYLENYKREKWQANTNSNVYKFNNKYALAIWLKHKLYSTYLYLFKTVSIKERKQVIIVRLLNKTTLYVVYINSATETIINSTKQVMVL